MIGCPICHKWCQNLKEIITPWSSCLIWTFHYFSILQICFNFPFFDLRVKAIIHLPNGLRGPILSNHWFISELHLKELKCRLTTPINLATPHIYFLIQFNSDWSNWISFCCCFTLLPLFTIRLRKQRFSSWTICG